MNSPTTQRSGSRLAMFLLGATLALGFTLSAHLLSTAIERIKHENSIKVKGTAERAITSDSATWIAEYEVRGTTLKDAYTGLEKSRQSVEKFFSESQVSGSECTYSALRIETAFKHDERGVATNTIEFYRLSQSVEIKSKDVQRIDRLSKDVTSLIKEGVEIRSYAPAYIYSGLEQIKLELLGAATQNAYERARTLAENSHGKVGGLSSASQGVFQITPLDSTEASDGGEYDTSTIDKKVKAVVTLEFHIET